MDINNDDEFDSDSAYILKDKYVLWFYLILNYIGKTK